MVSHRHGEKLTKSRESLISISRSGSQLIPNPVDNKFSTITIIGPRNVKVSWVDKS